MQSDVPMKPEQMLPPMCGMCRHLQIGNGPAQCIAFPNGIPDNILYGEAPDYIPEPHLEISPLQEGSALFEKDEGVDDRMVKDWDGGRAQLLIAQAEQDGLDLSE